MPAPSKKTTRPYLAAPQRRDHLLDVAARLVRHGGWAALSMQGLAAAAGVSRQLIYEYFASADELYRGDAHPSVRTGVRRHRRHHAAPARAVDATVAAAYELFLDLPAEERRALRALASDVESAAQPSGARQATPADAHRRPLGSLCPPADRTAEGEAGAVAWMLITAGWGLADSLADGALGRRRGVDLFVRFVVHALAAWQVRARTKRAIGGRIAGAAVHRGERNMTTERAHRNAPPARGRCCVPARRAARAPAAHAQPGPWARTETRQPCASFDMFRQPYFGDTHVHTAYSSDAVFAGTRENPRGAYRFAQGQPIGLPPYDAQGNPTRTAQLRRPLDFTAVTDHAEQFGEIRSA